MSVALRILVVVALQTAALAYMIYDRISVFYSGTSVTLRVKPVDPSDMFRGDYVILNYDVSTIDTGAVGGDDHFVQDRWAYVTLAKKDDLWMPTAATSEMPASQVGFVVLRGQVKSISIVQGHETLNLTYGIESFFVPQGRGKEIEDERQKGDLTAEIAVDAEGRGVIKSLRRADGTPMFVESLF